MTGEFESYLDKLTNFYIRVNRRRFWKSGDEADKLNAYWSLYNALKAAIQVISSILPFMTEYIWQNLVRQLEKNAPESIFLSEFPVEVLAKEKSDIISQVKTASDIINIGQRLRAENQLKVKQPLSKLFVIVQGEEKLAVELLADIIKDELNVKEVETVDDETRFNTPYLIINFGVAGRVLKGDVQKAKAALESASEKQMKEYVEGFDSGKVTLAGFEPLGAELFERKLKAKDEYVIAVENGLTVVLDTVITEELKQEGYLREIIRQAQILRKEADFNIEDRINANFETTDKLIIDIIEKFKVYIQEEVLIKNFNSVKFSADIDKDLEIDDYKINIKMAKIN